MSLPEQNDGHQLLITVRGEGGAGDGGISFEVVCPGRAECAMEEWPPDGERKSPCFVQFSLTELNLDCVEGQRTFLPIPIKWRVEGGGEDAELWVTL